MPANTPNRGYTYPIPTDPVDIPGDLQELATDVDNDVELNLAPIVGIPRAIGHMRSAGTQTIQPNIATPLNYQIQYNDTDNMVNTINQPTLLTINTAGFYIFHVFVRVPVTNWTNLVLRMLLNNTTEVWVADQEFTTGAQSTIDWTASWTYPMAVGDTMSVTLQTNGSGPLWVPIREFYGMRMAT
jgi:hypothetical protein